jgi:peptidoglycan/LPS O-acetylase OafA/YrhL
VEPRRASRRYTLLDPLRGVAATVVVLDHAAGLKLGYFAVLVFFVISGYCILASAEAGLERGMAMGEYMRRRVRRIYPPYLVSVLFFVATRLVKYRLGGTLDIARRTPAEWIQTLTLTQWLDLVTAPVSSYPYNNSALMVAAHWSLNYEEQFYLFVGLVMAACAYKRWPMRAILLPFTIGTIALMAVVPNLVIGLFVDYWPLFGVGAAVYYRVTGEGGARLTRALDVGLVALFAGSVGTLLVHGRLFAGQRYIWEDLAVTSGLALLLVLLRPYDERLMRTLPLRLLRKVGTISYSLYLIHQFNMTLAEQVAARVVGATAWRPLRVAVEVAFLWALASGFWWLFERPFLNAPPEGGRARAAKATLPTMGA